ncbi:peptidoglycan-binding domain-containing protein [Arenibaculum pallidiluteum]|uniref:peptidoglycan-binding domain-containing protein n=1 Tax=Arenibaculum pallidiluteum TaxID=2812559 RepID=UPI001A9662CE|nr:peptidoglycan-binding domain-containing protein [Arenibaculum pallidiluteum]
MTGLRRQAMASLLRSVVMAGGLTLAAATPAAAQEASKADIQWAQTVLKERGLYSGRENGDLNDPTRAALREFQRKAGIPVTGRLDPATTAKLMEGRQAQGTVGNLAAPKNSGTRPRSQAETAPSRPSAAPTTRIDGQEGGETGGGFLSRGGAVGSAGAQGSDAGAAPQAAPRSAVSGESLPGAGTAAVPDAPPPGLFVPEWVRTGIAALLVLVFAVAAYLWWASGRRKPQRPLREAPAEERREPTLGSARSELRADPPLRVVGDRRR